MSSDKIYPGLTAEEAAFLIPNGAMVAVSGFTPAGSPKAVPRALAKRARELHERGEPFQIKLLSGASTVSEDESRPSRRCLDTFLEPPDDVCLFSDAPPVAGSFYLVQPRSIVAPVRVAE